MREELRFPRDPVPNHSTVRRPDLKQAVVRMLPGVYSYRCTHFSGRLLLLGLANHQEPRTMIYETGSAIQEISDPQADSQKPQMLRGHQHLANVSRGVTYRWMCCENLRSRTKTPLVRVKPPTSAPRSPKEEVPFCSTVSVQCLISASL